MQKCHTRNQKIAIQSKGMIPIETLETPISELIFGLILICEVKGPVSGFVFDFLLWFCHPSKTNMSEGCWLFSFKMAEQSSGNRDLA